MICFKPVGLLHAPKVATYQYVLILHDLLTYLLSYGVFRELPLFLISSSSYLIISIACLENDLGFYSSS